ncbi:hypothetical protein JIN78_08415 [Roseibacillus ishigakijimensis]|uniref:LysM domain-containing protein n=1 Tax=Roseibacillus ishigakijimensis TaxID=454146 RepID=A0A934RT86_9BACT|nr:hypothetical protein [Roseibacillus ishigakijimensis]MBK1834081.1 hypothetical protein [Roseibacillus ishigakijimensis]
MNFSTGLKAEGIHDLVKPDFDRMREQAEEERLAEQARLEQRRQEEEAKRLEEERRLAAREAARRDPLVAVEELDLAGQDSGRQQYLIESGGSLGAIAAERYGSFQYFPLLEHWNGVSATGISVGRVIKTPSVATMMRVKGAKVLARYPEEVRGLLQLRDDYLALEPRLRASGGTLDDGLKSDLVALQKAALTIRGGFMVKRPGVTHTATGLLRQCRSLSDQLSAMSSGDFGREQSRLTRVHTHLAYALRNAMVWGEEDFK